MGEGGKKENIYSCYDINMLVYLLNLISETMSGHHALRATRLLKHF